MKKKIQQYLSSNIKVKVHNNEGLVTAINIEELAKGIVSLYEESRNKLDKEDIEQINHILDFEETNAELAHRQQYVKLLFEYYVNN